MNTEDKNPSLCIIDVGTRVGAKVGYGNMFIDWLSPHLPEWDFSVVSLPEGASLSCTSDFDGYLVTGSCYGVYDDVAWIDDLEDFLRLLRVDSISVVGVCFGHQLMAQAYGGFVEKSSKGWGAGMQQYEVTVESDVLPKNITSHCFHQDQIVKKPDEAQILASNQHCSLAMLEYSFPAISIQFHPEFVHDFASYLIDNMAGEKFSHDFAIKARKTLGKKDDNEAVAKWVAGFLNKNKKKNQAKQN